MNVWVFAVLSAAAWRTWRLAAYDTILEPARARLPARAREFLECPWCAGFWIAAAWATAWYLWPHVIKIGATIFALSAALILIDLIVLHLDQGEEEPDGSQGQGW